MREGLSREEENDREGKKEGGSGMEKGQRKEERRVRNVGTENE